MENTIKASEPFAPSLAKIVNRLYDEVDRAGGFTSEIENNLQLIGRYEEPTKDCIAQLESEYKEPNTYVDNMNGLISRLEIYNDRLAFSLRHIRELI